MRRWAGTWTGCRSSTMCWPRRGSKARRGARAIRGHRRARATARRPEAMPGGAIRRMLPDGRRLHLQHGPIDLVIEAFGARDEIAHAYGQAWTRFQTVLAEL